jgi:hypothetical protein
MARNIDRALSSAFAAIVCAGAAQAAPVTIDSEQKGAAAVLSAHHFMLDRNGLNNTRQLLINITIPAREVINGALDMLASATTPAALARSGGITLPCLQGGTLSATLSRGLVRTLKFSWNACGLEQFGLPATYNGVGEMVLVGDKFKVSAVPSLRLGNATQDLTITTFQSFPPYSDVTDTRSFNLRMIGLVPMSQEFVGFYVSGPWAYELTGFWEAFTRIVPPDPMYGLPSEHRQRITAERVVTSGYLKLPEDSPTFWLEDETWFHSGRFTTYFDNVNGWRNVTETTDLKGLRIHIQELYGIGRRLSVDGRATLGWASSRGSGCLSGDYTFKTMTPLLEWELNPGHIKSGELLINGSTTSRYSTPIQPDPAQTWFTQAPVSIDIAGLGQFDYLLDWGVSSGLQPIAQCSLGFTPVP